MAVIRESFAVAVLYNPEKRISYETTKRDQVTLHQHVRSGDKFRSDGVSQAHHWHHSDREANRLFGIDSALPRKVRAVDDGHKSYSS